MIVAGSAASALHIRGLTTSIHGRDKDTVVVDEVTIDVTAGEIVAIVGESGSGKSLTALSVMRLLREPVRLGGGAIELGGVDLATLPEKRLREIRGGNMAMVFQDPMTALNAYQTIGHQVEEAIRAHRPMPKAERRQEMLHLLEEVHIPDPELRCRQYPHELSGGQRQRVLIAMALANRPSVLIADEPTSGLDATIQAQVIALFRELNEKHQMAMVIITHNLGVVAGLCHRVFVMYAGRVVESGTTDQVLVTPRHPYTTSLLQAVPRLDGADGRLAAIPGQPPDFNHLPTGCAFHPRCWRADSRCQSELPPLAVTDGRPVRCWHPVEVHSRGEKGEKRAGSGGASGSDALSGDGLVKVYPARGTHRALAAVDGVSIRIRAGEAFAIVGESGSGKSTLGRLLACLERPTAGRVHFGSEELTTRKPAELRSLRRHIQYLFQDPFSSLDPRQRVADIIDEPLRNFGIGSSKDRSRRVRELIGLCGLGVQVLQRYPHELSGGQRRRVGIARALAPNPRVVILDEPLSALDVSVQAQIVNLLADLKAELNLTYVVISHDLGVVRHLCERVAVMYRGRFVEVGRTEQLFARPLHPYTVALLNSIPVLDPEVERQRRTVVLRDEASGPGQMAGCNLAPRCPIAQVRCWSEDPALLEHGDGQATACHFPGTCEAPTVAGP